MAKTIYLAGGYDLESADFAKRWHERASRALGSEFTILSPFEWEVTTPLEIIVSEMAEIEEADIVMADLTNPAWGLAMEIYEAFRCKRKVVGFGIDVHKASAWLTQHCTSIHETLEAAVAKLISEEGIHAKPPS